MFVEELCQTESGVYAPFVRYGDDGELHRVSWAPQSGSQQAVICSYEVEVGNFGPRGTGKTITLLMCFGSQVGLGFGINHRGVIFRHSQPQQSEVIALGQIIKEIWPEVMFNSMKSFYQWPTGEILYLSHYDQPSEFSDHIGKSYSFVGWEELVSWPDDRCYKSMFSCLRSINPKVRLMVRSTSNPGGVGHDWVKRRFRLSGIPPQIGPVINDSLDDEGNPEPPRRAISSTLQENKLLMETDPKYLDRIRASARSESERKAWVYGDWSAVGGGFLTDIWPDIRDTVVVPNFEVPVHWMMFRAGDWGWSKPYAFGWFAKSDGSDLTFPDGRNMHTVKGDLFLVSELYGCKDKNHPNKGVQQLGHEAAAAIAAHEVGRGWRLPGSRSRVKAGPLDLGAFDTANGVNIAADLEQGGARFEPSTKGPGSRMQGAAQVRQRLESVMRPEHGYRENPGLFVCERNHYWLDLVPSLPVDESNPDVIDANAIDHLFDMTAYAMRFDSSPGFMSGRVNM